MIRVRWIAISFVMLQRCFPHIGMFSGMRMNICTALWSFVNFCCLSQSEVSTDNRKVSTPFLHSNIFVAVVAIILIWTVSQFPIKLLVMIRFLLVSYGMEPQFWLLLLRDWLTLFIDNACVPAEWKLAEICPIFKRDDEFDKPKYRPASILVLLDKVFERCVQKQLVQYILQPVFV